MEEVSEHDLADLRRLSLAEDKAAFTQRMRALGLSTVGQRSRFEQALRESQGGAPPAADPASARSLGSSRLIRQDGDIASEESCSGTLLSPPTGWPGCYEAKGTKLKAFVGTTLAGTRVRVCAHISGRNAAFVAEVQLKAGSSRGNAERVQATTGWPIVGGYALYEQVDGAGAEPVFVGRPWWWNAKPNGAWVDATPRGGDHALVLVESLKTSIASPSTVLPVLPIAIRAVEGLCNRLRAVLSYRQAPA